MDARARQIADLEAALRTCRTQYEALLVDSRFAVSTREQEIRHLREQHTLLEGRYNLLEERYSALLAQVQSASPAPPPACPGTGGEGPP